MAHDYLGNPVSSTEAAAVAAIDDFVGGFLGYAPRIEAVLKAAERFPDDVLVNAYAGALNMLAETAEAPQKARRYLKAAQAGGPANDRERAMVAHLEAWIEGDLPRALDIGRKAVADHPRDLAMVKLHQYHAFNMGDFAEMLRIAETAIAASRDLAPAHAMLAFGLEQGHRLGEAEAAARAALAIDPDEPWAHHALAHVMLTQGRIEEGRRFLEGVSASWAPLNSFIYTHNWWHLALFYLSQGRDAQALAAYDQRAWARTRTYSQDQVGAVSLLARIEFAGVDVGDRWEDLADHLAPRATDTVQPFLSLQYLFGLARARRPQADTLMAAIRAEAARAPAFRRAAWADVAAPAGEGILAYLAGDGATAAAKLGAVLPRMAEVGGSHAQRDFFEQIHLEALMAAGRWGQAQQVLEARRHHDPEGVPLNRKLARAYDALGRSQEAAEAAARADRALSPQAVP